MQHVTMFGTCFDAHQMAYKDPLPLLHQNYKTSEVNSVLQVG